MFQRGYLPAIYNIRRFYVSFGSHRFNNDSFINPLPHPSVKNFINHSGIDLDVSCSPLSTFFSSIDTLLNVQYSLYPSISYVIDTKVVRNQTINNEKMCGSDLSRTTMKYVSNDDISMARASWENYKQKLKQSQFKQDISILRERLRSNAMKGDDIQIEIDGKIEENSASSDSYFPITSAEVEQFMKSQKKHIGKDKVLKPESLVNSTVNKDDKEDKIDYRRISTHNKSRSSLPIFMNIDDPLAALVFSQTHRIMPNTFDFLLPMAKPLSCSSLITSSQKSLSSREQKAVLLTNLMNASQAIDINEDLKTGDCDRILVAVDGAIEWLCDYERVFDLFSIRNLMCRGVWAQYIHTQLLIHQRNEINDQEKNEEIQLSLRKLLSRCTQALTLDIFACLPPPSSSPPCNDFAQMSDFLRERGILTIRAWTLIQLGLNEDASVDILLLQTLLAIIPSPPLQKKLSPFPSCTEETLIQRPWELCQSSSEEKLENGNIAKTLKKDEKRFWKRSDEAKIRFEYKKNAKNTVESLGFGIPPSAW